MKKALIACRTGMGSSMMLKIKVDQVIRKNNFPIEVSHDTLDAVPGFVGDLVITMADVVDEINRKDVYIIGVKNLMNTNELTEKLEKFINDTSN